MPAEAADAFSHGALNRSGWEVYATLREASGLTLAEVTAALGCARVTVWRALDRMRQVGVAQYVGGRWVAVAKPDWAAVAARLGTAGRTARRRDRHRLDRAAHQAVLEERERRDAAIRAAIDPVTHQARLLSAPVEVPWSDQAPEAAAAM